MIKNNWNNSMKLCILGTTEGKKISCSLCIWFFEFSRPLLFFFFLGGRQQNFVCVTDFRDIVQTTMIKGDISKNSPLILDRLLKIITKQTNNTMGPNIYNASIESLTLDLSHLLKKKYVDVHLKVWLIVVYFWKCEYFLKTFFSFLED